MKLETVKKYVGTDEYVYYQDNAYKIVGIKEMGNYKYAIIDSSPMQLVYLSDLSEFKDTRLYTRKKNILLEIKRLEENKEKIILELKNKAFKTMKTNMLLNAAFSNNNDQQKLISILLPILQKFIDETDFDNLESLKKK